MLKPEGVDRTGLETAVIGMSGRFPGARNIDEFWNNVKQGIESISFFTHSELKEAGVGDDLLESSQYVKAYGYIEDSEAFDAFFFGYTSAEAKTMDPQMRIFHQCVWEALEDAGYAPDSLKGLVGVYAGASTKLNWKQCFILPLTGTDGTSASEQYALDYLSDKDFLCSQVSYKLGLKGPSYVVHAAYSTALLAIHMAGRALLSGECKMALAGAVTITRLKKTGYFFQEGMIQSPNGHCKVFDQHANGTVFGDGAGVVLLKRLKNAIADGDNIYAVIKGSAVNNDGNRKKNVWRPSVEAQAEVIKMAQHMARVEPESIGCVETHGTGIPAADVAEINALKLAFNTRKKRFCAIVSVKTNIGHLDAAAGMASFIKTVMALKYRLIPPTLHFENPNPKFQLENSPFYVNTTLSEWKTDSFPLRAGISTFGMAGTNVHVILEEAPVDRGQKAEGGKHQLILLSAKTPTALEQMTQNLSTHFIQHPEINLADAAYTLQVGRKAFNYRRMVVCTNVNEAVDQLYSLGQSSSDSQYLVQRNRSTKKVKNEPHVVFLFSGLDYISPNMGLQLYQEEGGFREEMERCFNAAESITGQNFRNIFYPQSRHMTILVAHSGLFQFIVEYSMAKLMIKWGVKPYAMIGHGMGEYTAACLAGVFSLEDALKLVLVIDKSLQSTPEELDEKLKQVAFNRPQVPYVSSLTGQWITVEEAKDPDYWARLLREKVRFKEVINFLLRESTSTPIFVQMVPNKDLTSYESIHLMAGSEEKMDEVYYLLNQIGRLWVWGVNIDGASFNPTEKRSRVSLPPYPFEYQRFPQDREPREILFKQLSRDHSRKRKPDITNWFYIPSWVRTGPPVSPCMEPTHSLGNHRWLVFIDSHGLGTRIVSQLKLIGQEAISVTAGETAQKIMEHYYTINPGSEDDYDLLVKEVCQEDTIPDRIIHLWSIIDEFPESSGENQAIHWRKEKIKKAITNGFDSLVYLVRAFDRQGMSQRLSIEVVTNQMQEVIGGDLLYPEQAAVLGAVKQIPLEYSNIICRSIDIVLLGQFSLHPQVMVLTDQLLGEFSRTPSDSFSMVAYRRNHRWEQTVQAVQLEKLRNLKNRTPVIKENGVYLVTGGLGGVALKIIEYLARSVNAKLILIGGPWSSVPSRLKWDQWLVTHHEYHRTSTIIRKLLELEELGTEMVMLGTETDNYSQMETVTRDVLSRFGTIDGVIYCENDSDNDWIWKGRQDWRKSALVSEVMSLLVLHRMMDDANMNLNTDFFVYYASLDSILPMAGRLHRCAGNALIDAFVRFRALRTNTYPISIYWNMGQDREKAADVLDVFNRILAYSPVHVVVSAKDISTAVGRWKSQHAAEIEDLLLETWQDFFGFEVSIHDHFFDLGGDSLGALIIGAKIQNQWNINVPLEAFLKNPTIEKLSGYLKNEKAKNGCYWEQSDWPKPLPLPVDFPVHESEIQPSKFRFKREKATFLMDYEASREYQRMVLTEHVTLYMLFLAIINILLSKICSQEEIVICSHSHFHWLMADRKNERLLPESTNAENVGNFVILRNSPTDNKPFKEFLKEVKENILKTYENQDCGFQFKELAEEMAGEKSIEDYPFFNVMAAFQDDYIHNLDAGTVPTVDLLWVFRVLEEEFLFTVSVFYNSILFRRDTIERFLDYFKKIFETVALDPHFRISEIEIISDHEKRQILFDFNNTEAEYPGHKTVDEEFASQVIKTPHYKAVIFGDIQLTYQVLNKQANQLARMLIARGVSVNSIVVLMVERSIEMMIGLWGIMKAGGIYLPISPNYPGERIKYLINDSRAACLLTLKKFKKEWNQFLPVISLEENDWYEGETHHLEPVNCSRDLAYLIYTSGTTGKPKGTLIEHQSVMNRLNWMQKGYPIDEKDILIQKTPIVFDVSIWELFWWSFEGAALFVLAPELEKHVDALVEAVGKYNVTTMHFVPSMLKVFLEYIEEAGEVGKLSGLRQVFASGEALGRHQVENFNRLLNTGNGARLINLYGPTEATVDVSFFNCSTAEIFETIPIGKPIDNIQLYILNKNLQLQPIGIEGELYISGVGLARGYLNLPELTAEKFGEHVTGAGDSWETEISLNKNFCGVPRTPTVQRKKMSMKATHCAKHRTPSLHCKCSPTQWAFFKKSTLVIEGKKIYKTGDLARWLPDGNIEFLGRIDQQVKIRGFRIELGEIENHLIKHDKITDAVVIASDDKLKGEGSSDTSLCAYVVTKSQCTSVELRAYLSTFLPDYMIPAHFVPLERIPLTVSGKVDRKVLPVPSGTLGESYTAPENELETELVELWSDVLGIRTGMIGTETNFFELGGHSLRAITLMSKIHKALEVKIPLSKIFKLSTIKKLAGYIEAAGKHIYFSIEVVEKREYYPLSSAQKRLFIVQQMEEKSSAYNLPQVAILEGELDRKKLQDSFKKLIHRHENLRTSFLLVDGEPTQKIHEQSEWEMEFKECQDQYRRTELNKIIETFIRPFDLTGGPLLRGGLLELNQKKHLLILDCHHIIVDGVSLRILLRDISAFYNDNSDDLVRLRLQYKDYSLWQKKLSTSYEVKKQEQYWLNRFEDGVPVVNLPTDYPRPRLKSYAGEAINFILEEELSCKVVEFVKNKNVTLYMFFLAVYNILLSKYSEQEDIVVGTSISNRPHADLDNIIGMFANVLVMRNFPLKYLTFSTFLENIKQDTLTAYENQGCQFEELVKVLNIERELSRSPLFDVVFEFQNRDRMMDGKGNGSNHPGEHSKLQIVPYSFSSNVSRYDLIFIASENDNFFVFNVQYAKTLFKRSTIEHMKEQFIYILEQVLENPEIIIKQIKCAHGFLIATANVLEEDNDEWILE
jgi:amino acid adenylation domain-containing protein